MAGDESSVEIHSAVSLWRSIFVVKDVAQRVAMARRFGILKRLFKSDKQCAAEALMVKKFQTHIDYRPDYGR